MAILKQLGKQYPCKSQGIYVDPDEDVDLYPGEVLEAHFESDTDITPLQTAFTIRDILLTKDDYPDFVLHYVRVETRKIIAQFSYAPPEVGNAITTKDGKISTRISAVHLPVWAIILIVTAAIAFFTGLILRWIRGYLWSPPLPMGNAVITAQDAVTNLPISDVPIYVDGEHRGNTDGGSITVKNLLQGDHQFAGETIEGYQAPNMETATIIKDQTIDITIWYWPVGVTPPTTGWLQVYTDPPGGKVYVDTIDKGTSPIAVELGVGTHSVGFGSIEGYITPPVQTVTITGGKTKSITGTYIIPGEPWWQSLIKWTAIGLTGTAAAAILIPRIAQAAKIRGKEET